MNVLTKILIVIALVVALCLVLLSSKLLKYMPDNYTSDSGVSVYGPLTNSIVSVMFAAVVAIGFIIYKGIVYKEEEKKIEEKPKTQ